MKRANLTNNTQYFEKIIFIKQNHEPRSDENYSEHENLSNHIPEII